MYLDTHKLYVWAAQQQSRSVSRGTPRVWPSQHQHCRERTAQVKTRRLTMSVMVAEKATANSSAYTKKRLLILRLQAQAIVLPLGQETPAACWLAPARV